MNESFFVKELLRNNRSRGALDLCLDTETVFRDVFCGCAGPLTTEYTEYTDSFAEKQRSREERREKRTETHTIALL